MTKILIHKIHILKTSSNPELSFIIYDFVDSILDKFHHVTLQLKFINNHTHTYRHVWDLIFIIISTRVSFDYYQIKFIHREHQTNHNLYGMSLLLRVNLKMVSRATNSSSTNKGK